MEHQIQDQDLSGQVLTPEELSQALRSGNVSMGFPALIISIVLMYTVQAFDYFVRILLVIFVYSYAVSPTIEYLRFYQDMEGLHRLTISKSLRAELYEIEQEHRKLFNKH